MNNDDERDHAEEAANRRHMAEEGAAELAAERRAGQPWTQHELEAMSVKELRVIACDARYRWELTKPELIKFILDYQPRRPEDAPATKEGAAARPAAPVFSIGWTQLVGGPYRGAITLWLECDGGMNSCTQVHGWEPNDPAPLAEIERAKAAHLAEVHGGAADPKPLPGELWADPSGDEWLVTPERWLSRPAGDVDMTGWRLAAEAETGR